VSGYNGDFWMAKSYTLLRNPQTLWWDAVSQVLVFLDQDNDVLRVRRYDPYQLDIAPIGTISVGSAGHPPGLVGDTMGGFYVSDYFSNTLHKFLPSRNDATIGSQIIPYAGFSPREIQATIDGSGDARDVFLTQPTSVYACDGPDGLIFIGDAGAAKIFQIDPVTGSNIIQTLAGDFFF
jgi:hypothetical protein